MSLLAALGWREAGPLRFARTGMRDGRRCFLVRMPALSVVTDAGRRRLPSSLLTIPVPEPQSVRGEPAGLAPATYLDLAQPWVGPLVLRRENGAILAEGVDYSLNRIQGRLLGSVHATARADYDWAPHRYDRVVLDLGTGAVRIVRGPERRHDVNDYIPATSNGCRALFNVYVNRDFCEFVPVHDWDGVVRRGREAAHRAWAAKGRASLPLTMARLRPGLPLTLASYGDSNGALGPATDVGAPDGARDRVDVWARYPAETLARLDRVPGDPERMRDGWNWRLARGLEARFGSPCTYRNWCIAGTNAGMDRAAGLPGGRDPARLGPFLAAPWDLALLQFGANAIDPKRFGAAYNYDHTAGLIAAVRQSGREVLVLGLPRLSPVPSPGFTAWWRKANRAVIAAARDAGAAHVDFSVLCGPGAEGGLGLSPTTLCEQNRFNHPGPYEHRAYAALMLSLFTA